MTNLKSVAKWKNGKMERKKVINVEDKDPQYNHEYVCQKLELLFTIICCIIITIVHKDETQHLSVIVYV